MSHARRSRGRPADARGPSDEDRTLTVKVVLMELARTSGPISAADLAERTLLSTDAVEAALSDIAEAGLCTVRPGDDRRPPRYQIEDQPAADA